jgi:serine/threonine-protein kinase
MLFELLSGRLPFMADSQMRLLMMHIESPVPGLDALGAKVPQELYEVVEKALAKKPDDRYQSALDLANALVAALEGARRVGRQDVDAVVAAPGGQGRVTGPRAALAETGIDTSTPQRSERALVTRDTIEPRAKRVLEREVVDKPARRTWLFVAAAAVLVGGGAVVAATSGGEATEPSRVAVAPPTAGEVAVTSPPTSAAPTVAPAPTRLAAGADAGPTTPDVTVAAVAEVAVPDVAAPAPEVVAVADTPPAPPALAPSIALTTDPPGALVLLDGHKLGTTPLSLPRPQAGVSAKLTVKLAGHTPLEQLITRYTADLTLPL